MRFANPEYLYLLAILPLMLLFFLYSRKKRRRDIAEYGDPELVARLMPKKASMRSSLTFWAILVASAFVIFALARPRYGIGKQTITTKGLETVIALDISNSMLAVDDPAVSGFGGTTRLDKAKSLVRRLISVIIFSRFSTDISRTAL